MGACYSITARIGVKDRRSASRAIRRYIREHDGVDCDFALDDYRAEGVSTRSFDGLIRIVFAGWKGTEYHVRRESDFSVYTNAFHASYGWESVMLDAVERLKPFLKSNSSFRIYSDSSAHFVKVKRGVAVGAGYKG